MNNLKTDAKSYYRSRIDDTAEQEYLDAECAEICAQQKSSVVTDCSQYVDQTIAPYFMGARKKVGSLSHLPRNMDGINVECWAALPKLGIASRPRTFVGEIESQKILNSPCYKCLIKSQVWVQSRNSVGPDKRFWIGAGAAGAAVVIATLVGAIRR